MCRKSRCSHFVSSASCCRRLIHILFLKQVYFGGKRDLKKPARVYAPRRRVCCRCEGVSPPPALGAGVQERAAGRSSPEPPTSGSPSSLRGARGPSAHLPRGLTLSPEGGASSTFLRWRWGPPPCARAAEAPGLEPQAGDEVARRLGVVSPPHVPTASRPRVLTGPPPPPLTPASTGRGVRGWGLGGRGAAPRVPGPSGADIGPGGMMNDAGPGLGLRGDRTPGLLSAC